MRRPESNDSSSITIEPIHATKQALPQRESANSTEQDAELSAVALGSDAVRQFPDELFLPLLKPLVSLRLCNRMVAFPKTFYF